MKNRNRKKEIGEIFKRYNYWNLVVCWVGSNKSRLYGGWGMIDSV